jgi:hypothetical protein
MMISLSIHPSVQAQLFLSDLRDLAVSAIILQPSAPLVTKGLHANFQEIFLSKYGRQSYIPYRYFSPEFFYIFSSSPSSLTFSKRITYTQPHSPASLPSWISYQINLWKDWAAIFDIEKRLSRGLLIFFRILIKKIVVN